MLNRCLSGDELTLAASAMAMALARGRSADELGVLGNLLQAVGQNLSLISSQREVCDSCGEKN